jgi:hypothetical protein
VKCTAAFRCLRKGEPMITVTVWHNVATDQACRHTGMLDGYQPGDPMVAVFTYQADPPDGPGGDRRRGVRHLQSPPGPRRRGASPPLLPAQAAVAVVPQKFCVLHWVVLRVHGPGAW